MYIVFCVSTTTEVPARSSLTNQRPEIEVGDQSEAEAVTQSILCRVSEASLPGTPETRGAAIS